jgi:hypothetical protein
LSAKVNAKEKILIDLQLGKVDLAWGVWLCNSPSHKKLPSQNFKNIDLYQSIYAFYCRL